jgi:uncharacterized protein YaiI (UPF0178 family)
MITYIWLYPDCYDFLFDGDACPCKEEIEKEEALALAKALEVSGTDPPTPKIPGLTPTEKEEVVTIRIQPDVCNASNYCLF